MNNLIVYIVGGNFCTTKYGSRWFTDFDYSDEEYTFHDLVTDCVSFSFHFKRLTRDVSD